MADRPENNNTTAMSSSPYQSSKTLRAACRNLVTEYCELGTLIYRYAKPDCVRVSCASESDYEALRPLAQSLGHCTLQPTSLLVRYNTPLRHKHHRVNWMEITAPDHETVQTAKTEVTHLTFTGNFDPPHDIDFQHTPQRTVTLRFQAQSAEQRVVAALNLNS